MTHTLASFIILVLALTFVLTIAFVVIAVIAGSIRHAWGTESAWEWTTELLRRVFIGGLRHRFIKAVNSQYEVAVDRTRRVCSRIAVSVTPEDAAALAGVDGDLTQLADDAARTYARYARSSGLVCATSPQVVIVPVAWMRRGNVKARPVSATEFTELWNEMVCWNEDAQTEMLLSEGAEIALGTLLLDDKTVNAADIATESFDQAAPTSIATSTPQLLLTDGQLARHSVSKSSVIVGRGGSCDLRLHNPEISREHANIYFQEGSWWIRDRGSQNGTTVNGAQIKGSGPAQLFPGSRVILGSESGGEKLTVSGLVNR